MCCAPGRAALHAQPPPVTCARSFMRVRTAPSTTRENKNIQAGVAKPSGSAASQVMSYPEMLNFLTPPKNGGGFKGVNVDRTWVLPEHATAMLK